MKLERQRIITYYKHLTSFYPRVFRERFEESLTQTFIDVCNEELKLKGKISLLFLISTFSETAAAIVSENWSELKEAHHMNSWLKNVCLAGIISLFLSVIFTLGTFFSDNPEQRLGEFSFPISDFLRGWLIQTVIFTLIVGGLRTGESGSLKKSITTLAAAGIFGALLIAPFAFMEYWNNSVIQSGESPFPVMLFIGLWLTPFMSFLAATPIVRCIRAGESVLVNPISLVLRVTFLTLAAILWLNLIRDQMPCLLGGVPGCD